MLIGMVIDTSGLFSAPDVKAFEEFGRKMEQREKSEIGTTRGTGNVFTIKLNNP